MERVLLTMEEAADRLSIGRTKVYELVAKGQLSSVTIGRCRRITPAALRQYVAALEATRNSCSNQALPLGQQLTHREQRALTRPNSSSPKTHYP